MTDHVPRPERTATSPEARVAELHRLADADYASTARRRAANPTWPVAPAASRNTTVAEPLYGAAAIDIRDQLREPTDLQVAVDVAHQLLDSNSVPSLREALRLLLRAIGAETTTTVLPTEPPALRCPAAIPSDSTACDGPVVVLVLGLGDGGVAGCEHHAVRLMAAAPGTYPVALPHAPAGTATRVFRAVGEAGRR